MTAFSPDAAARLRQMRRENIAWLALLLIAALNLAAYVFSWDKQNQVTPLLPIGTEAPDFHAVDEHGLPVRLADLTGPVALTFADSSNSASVQEIDLWLTAISTYPAVNFRLVVATDDLEHFRLILAGRTPPILVDDGALRSAYRVTGVPLTYFFNADHRVVALRQGGPLTSAQLAIYLARLNVIAASPGLSKP